MQKTIFRMSTYTNSLFKNRKQSMKKNIGLILFFTTVFLANCTLSSVTHTNRAKDQDFAKAFMEKFFVNFKEGNTKMLYPLFSTSPYTNSMEKRNEKIDEMFNSSIKTLGPITYTKVISCNTKVNEGDKPSAEYFISFEVGHQKYITKESFKLNQEGDSVKITYFKVDPIRPL